MKLVRSNENDNNKIFLSGSDLTGLNELVEVIFVWNTGEKHLHIVDQKQFPLEVIHLK